MRVIVKHHDAKPLATDLDVRGGKYEAIRAAIGGRDPGSCITHIGVRVWCDDDALQREPFPPLNLVRPNDGAPIHGSVVVVGEDGPEMCDLTDRQIALWMATLALIGVDRAGTWRLDALDELVPLIHDVDAEMFDQLRVRVAHRNPELGARWPGLRPGRPGGAR